jgi:hypothetical protein
MTRLGPCGGASVDDTFTFGDRGVRADLGSPDHAPYPIATAIVGAARNNATKKGRVHDRNLKLAVEGINRTSDTASPGSLRSPNWRCWYHNFNKSGGYVADEA